MSLVGLADPSQSLRVGADRRVRPRLRDAYEYAINTKHFFVSTVHDWLSLCTQIYCYECLMGSICYSVIAHGFHPRCKIQPNLVI
jgi:hypothetical protein